MNRVLCASKNHQVAMRLANSLGKDVIMDKAHSGKSSLVALREGRPDICFLDIEFLIEYLPKDGLKDIDHALQSFWKAGGDVPLVILAQPEKLRLAVEAVKVGAADYLSYPLESLEIELVIQNLRERLSVQSELDYLRSNFWKAETQGLVQTRSPKMRKVYESIEAVASTKANVLINGDTGTGKSLLAKLIHLHSNRVDGAFVAVHCGSIPDTLVESELFGHEKGSFTGAERRKLGRFQVADGGTIFLDEVGTITPNAQIKLLQVLQESSFTRVGGEQDITVDVRMIAASNEDLQVKAGNGQFRRDLYYRLNVFPLELPNLRERSEDIPHLANHFLRKLNKKHGKGLKGIIPEVMLALQGYDWPGNIRELENLLERAYILEKGTRLSSAGFPAELMAMAISDCAVEQNICDLDLTRVCKRAVDEVEHRYLYKLLDLHKGKVEPCAAQAGVTTRQLHNLLAKYSLKYKDFR
jgi:DNA-binding NtrC family response regulator